MLSLFASLSTEASWPILALLGLISIFASYVIFSPRQNLSPHSPKQISDQYPIFGALRYFSARWDFYQDAIAESKTGNFSFYLGKYGVIGFSGRQARKEFFESKVLSLHEGYAAFGDGLDFECERIADSVVTERVSALKFQILLKPFRGASQSKRRVLSQITSIDGSTACSLAKTLENVPNTSQTCRSNADSFQASQL